MLRRQARLRREYLYRKVAEDKHNQLQEKKDRLKRSLDEGIPIHGDLRREALALQDKLRWNDEGMLTVTCGKGMTEQKSNIFVSNRTKCGSRNWWG